MIALAATDARCLPAPPAGARVVRRIPPALFGSGLVDAIPDAALTALADPDDRDGDGVSGRAALVIDAISGQRRVGRFGWQALDASLLAAVGRAFAVELGVTNRAFPHEAAGDCDTRPDPEDRIREETGHTTLDHLTAFVRRLPPLSPRPLDARARHGETMFAAAGCAACHVPAVSAGVTAFSDFLLHDIGTGDGSAQGAAADGEFRTAPLWGVGTRRLLLHDGSALTIEQAILRHGGEAADSRDRFAALAVSDQQSLMAFLGSR